MSENTKLWDILGRTDPKHTKAFTRGGGFKGTAIKPMWSYRRMTEEFGPCGIGWGVGEPVFQVVPGADGEVLVYCTASVWYASPMRDINRVDVDRCTVYGVGGDKVINKFSSGLKSDDEAFKKAFTDAVTNALKLIGVGADVHMGMFDDNKYVNSMRDEFDDTPQKPVSSASLKREEDPRGDKIWTQVRNEMAECQSTVKLRALFKEWRAKAEKDNWPRAWINTLESDFKHEAELIKKREEAAVETQDDVFPGDLPSEAKYLMAG